MWMVTAYVYACSSNCLHVCVCMCVWSGSRPVPDGLQVVAETGRDCDDLPL